MNPDEKVIPVANLPIGNPVVKFGVSPDKKEAAPVRKINDQLSSVNEVVSKRTAQTKTYLAGVDTEGKQLYAVVLDKQKLHYQETNGSWQETDLTIQNVNGRLFMDTAPYTLEVYQDRVGYFMTDSETGETLSIELIQIGDANVDNTLIQLKLDTQQVFWDGLLPNIHFKVLLTSFEPKLYTMLDNETVPKSLTWKVIQSSPFELLTKGFDDNDNKIETVVSRRQIDETTVLYTETWTGRVSRIADKKTRIKSWFNDPVYPVIIDPTVTKSISTANDDGSAKGLIWFNTLNYFGRGTGSYFGGFRFQGVGIPVGATITSATLKVKVIAKNGTPLIKIKGNKVASAVAWATGGGESIPTTMTKTTATTNWSPVNGTVNSVDVTAQVGEIVGLGGWASGNNMKFGQTNIVSTNSNYIRFSDFEHSPANAAQLVIVYTSASGPLFWQMTFK